MLASLKLPLLLGVAVALTFACSKPATKGVAHVIVISLDTTRADFLGCYGRASARTPNLDAFASSATLFEHAVAPAPTTLASHADVDDRQRIRTRTARRATDSCSAIGES
jgi:hypothetical protein